MPMKAMERWAASVGVQADALTDAILDARLHAMETVMAVAAAHVAAVATAIAPVAVQALAHIVVHDREIFILPIILNYH